MLDPTSGTYSIYYPELRSEGSLFADFDAGGDWRPRVCREIAAGMCSRGADGSDLSY